MQICLSQQSPSPSHHFLHSNAFSHLNKTPLPATRRGFARFVDIHFCTFAMSSEETRNKRRFLRARLCRVYYRDSVETIKKWTRLEIFFPLRCITLPRCFQQEAVRLRGGCVGWMGKVNASFLQFLSGKHHFGRYMDQNRRFTCCPCLPQRGIFPDFAALLDSPALTPPSYPSLGDQKVNPVYTS